MLRTRTCEICGIIFQKILPPNAQRSGRGRFCSIKCKNKWSKGKHFSPDSEWKKGMEMIFTDEHRKNLSIAKTGCKSSVGNVNGKWKGDGVGYFALHSWVKRQLGKANLCLKCDSRKNVQWANKSHTYKRDIYDWLELCAKCHRQYDKDSWGIATKKFNL